MWFFFLYTLITSLVLINVVVAVLLDNFTQCHNQVEAEARAEKAGARITGYSKSRRCLEPLMNEILGEYDNFEHLDTKIDSLFRAFDLSEDGALSFQELQRGFHLLGLTKTINLSLDDWDYLTRGGIFLNDDSRMSAEQFHKVMMLEVRIHTARRLASCQTDAAMCGEDVSAAVALAMKLALIRDEPGWNPLHHPVLAGASAEVKYEHIAYGRESGRQQSLKPDAPAHEHKGKGMLADIAEGVRDLDSDDNASQARYIVLACLRERGREGRSRMKETGGGVLCMYVWHACVCVLCVCMCVSVSVSVCVRMHA